MKINIVVSGIFKSGGMKIIWEYANRLTIKGHSVVVYYPYISYDFYKGFPEITLNLKKNYWHLKNYYQAKKKLKFFYPAVFQIKCVPLINNLFLRNADVTIATIWHTSYSVMKLDRTKGKKIYFIQDYEIWNSDIEIVNNSYKLPMTRITISAFLNKLLKEKFNSDSEIVYNGVDFSKFNSNGKNFNKSERNIAFIDYKLEKKNVEISIKVLKKIKENFNNVNVIGFGLESFHNLPECIKFIENPNDDEIRNIYSSADIFLFTSTVEGFGLPPAEAMASKCAVVTSPVGAIPEFSKHDESALFIDPANIDNIYESVASLISNNSKLKKISENGYDSVRKTLDWEKSVNKFENILLSKE